MILCFGWEKHNPCSRAPSLHGLLDPEAEVTTILWKAGIYSSNDTVSYPIKLKSLSLSSSSWLWEPQISHKIPTFFYYPTHATELEFQSYPLCPHTSVWEPWTRLQTRSAGVDSWHRQYISFFSKTFRLSLGHTQPPSQWVIWGGGFSGGYSIWVMKPTAHLHLVPRLRMTGATPLLPFYGMHMDFTFSCSFSWPFDAKLSKLSKALIGRVIQ